MAIGDTIRRLLGMRRGGSTLFNMSVPPGWNHTRYLQAYGQLGWLFGAVSVIANSVAEVEWQLYTRRNGDREQITDHVLLDLLDSVNPHQTRYQFIQLGQTYYGLVGEFFIVLFPNRLGVPGEMWIVPPQYMRVVPGVEQHISHYIYKRGQVEIRLEVPEVIHIFNPDPANPFRGVGTAQALASVIASEKAAELYTEKLFYNDATPGLAVTYKDIPPKEERDSIREEWDENFRGWANAHRPVHLFGGQDIKQVMISNRDLQFEKLRKLDRDTILGGYHIPTSIMGLAEVGSRARAEADEYIFSKRVVKPNLVQLREAFNEQLCPLFDPSLELDFTDPVPADREQIVKEAEALFKAAVITREEARTLAGYEPKPEKGETFLVPFNMLSETAKMVKKDATNLSDEQKEALWQVYRAKTERQELSFKKVLKVLFNDQEAEVIKYIKDGGREPDGGLNLEDENDIFTKGFRPVIEQTFDQGFEDAIEEAKQLDQRALEWIERRSLVLAKMVNGTTKDELRTVLAQAFEEGKSIPNIVKDIEGFYTNGYEHRAPIVARTEVIAASNEGAIQRYETEGVKKVQFYTSLDDRVCPECEPLHGSEYAVRDSHGIIPVHPQCRCTWIPEV